MKEQNEVLKAENDIEVVDFEVVEENTTPVSVESELTDDEALAQIPVNIPYKKILNDEGDLVNPITKGDPYINHFMSGEQKRSLIKKATKHPKNNKKGIRLVVTPFAKDKFTKTEIVRQTIPENVTPITDLLDGKFILNGYKNHKSRTIIHNKTQL